MSRTVVCNLQLILVLPLVLLGPGYQAILLSVHQAFGLSSLSLSATDHRCLGLDSLEVIQRPLEHYFHLPTTTKPRLVRAVRCHGSQEFGEGCDGEGGDCKHLRVLQCSDCRAIGLSEYRAITLSVYRAFQYSPQCMFKKSQRQFQH